MLVNVIVDYCPVKNKSIKCHVLLYGCLNELISRFLIR